MLCKIHIFPQIDSSILRWHLLQYRHLLSSVSSERLDVCWFSWLSASRLISCGFFSIASWASNSLCLWHSGWYTSTLIWASYTSFIVTILSVPLRVYISFFNIPHVYLIRHIRVKLFYTILFVIFRIACGLLLMVFIWFRHWIHLPNLIEQPWFYKRIVFPPKSYIAEKLVEHYISFWENKFTWTLYLHQHLQYSIDDHYMGSLELVPISQWL